MITREKISGVLDRKILTAMIVSDDFLRDVRDIYSPDYLSATYARVVADWCLAYFKKYKKAPRALIQERYVRAVRDKELRDDDAEKLVGGFLSSISREYDSDGAEINVPFLLDETERLFRKRNLTQLAIEIQEAMARSDSDEAEDLLRQHKRVERAQAGGFDPLRDDTRIHSMFSAPLTPLIQFDGALGELLNPLMTRDQCVGVMGPEKSSKTFMLTEMNGRAIMSRRNVAMFETGDLSESQLMRRFYSSILCKRIDDRFSNADNIERRAVVDCVRNQMGLCNKSCRKWEGTLRNSMVTPIGDIPSDYRVCVACSNDFVPCVGYVECAERPVMIENDVKAQAAIISSHMGSQQIRFHVTASNTMTAEGIDEQLLRWKEREGFVPDVIIVDYADIMAGEEGARDERDKQNERWKWFRRMSQEWHALFVVATQTDAAAYTQDSVRLSNFSEDKRKYAHVTGMLAIHRTAAERKARCLRLSWLIGRELPSDRLEDEVVLCERLNVSRIHGGGSFWRKQAKLSDWRYDPKSPNGIEITGENV